MKISLFGTCRLQCIKNHFNCTNFDENISFVHSTKEVIQLIHFITNKSTIEDNISRYCFRTGILLKKPIIYKESFLEDFNNTDLFVIELCSSRKYSYKNYYLHHLAIDNRLGNNKDTPRKIKKATNITHQSPLEIKQDIKTIKELLKNKKILLVSHINALVKKNEKPAAADNTITKLINKFSSGKQNYRSEMVQLPRRAELINLVSISAKELGIDFFDPSIVLQKHPQEEILCPERTGTPPGHYTEFGNKIIGELFAEKIRAIMKISS